MPRRWLAVYEAGRIGSPEANERPLTLTATPRRADTLPAMQAALARLREQLGSDSAYFAKVYTHTFDFARAEGQRSLGERPSFASPVLPCSPRVGAGLRTPISGDVNMGGQRHALTQHCTRPRPRHSHCALGPAPPARARGRRSYRTLPARTRTATRTTRWTARLRAAGCRRSTRSGGLTSSRRRAGRACRRTRG